MTIFLIKAAQLMLALAILVFIHELGHFSFAKLFKVRVDKFYLFFNPQFSIVRFKKVNGKWKFKFFAKNLPYETPVLDENGKQKLDEKGKKMTELINPDTLPEDDWRRSPDNTEWGLGWIPLGGYCKIGGMMDESQDPNVAKVRNEEWAYESRPVWQRMLIDAGGVIFNFVSAIIIFVMILFCYGKETIPLENAYLGYSYCQTAKNNGFINGDKIISVNGENVFEKADVAEKIIIEGKTNIVVLRDSQEITLDLPEDFSQQIIAAKEKIFMAERFPFVIDSVIPQTKGQSFSFWKKLLGKKTTAENLPKITPAKAAGLLKGDSIVGVNGKNLFEFYDIKNEFTLNKGKTVELSIYRNDSLITRNIDIDTLGAIGVAPKTYFNFLKTHKIEYGFFASFPAGWKLGIETLVSYVKQFRLVFTKEGVQSLGGFGTIGSIFPSEWIWSIFWSMTAFLSVILAFMNILPIPVLDGGHLLFLLYEAITRRKPSEKFMEISLNIGLYLLLALMIFANGNDILRWLGFMK